MIVSHVCKQIKERKRLTSDIVYVLYSVESTRKGLGHKSSETNSALLYRHLEVLRPNATCPRKRCERATVKIGSGNAIVVGSAD